MVRYRLSCTCADESMRLAEAIEAVNSTRRNKGMEEIHSLSRTEDST